MSKSLTELRDEALRIAVEHGFRDASVGEDVALFHSEISEMFEDYRNGRSLTEQIYAYGDGDDERTICPDRLRFDGSLRKPVGIPSELADVIIRILHFSGKHGIDIERAVTEKMEFNEGRPFKHGWKVL